MAPKRELRTYSRGKTSTVSCVEAFDILFTKNLTQRKLAGKSGNRKKVKYEVKDLPAKVKSVLNDESSLHVNFTDSFDQLLKKTKNKTETSGRKQSKSRKNAAYVKVNELGSFKDVSSHPLVLQKLGSYSNKTLEKSSWSSWFNQPTPTEVGITNSLEIEYVGVAGNSRKAINAVRASPIVLRSHTRSIESDNELKAGKSQSAHQNSIDIECAEMFPRGRGNLFANCVQPNPVLHSSTPLMANKRPHKSLAQTQTTISPIKLDDDELRKSILESLHEIGKWSLVVPKGFAGDKIANSSTAEKCESEKELSFHFEDFLSKLDAKPHVPDAERFCETSQHIFNFSNDSFASTRNFVTNRRGKFSVVPRKHKASRLRRNVIHKELMVILYKNLFNYSKTKLATKHTPGCLFNKVPDRKQLVVKLTRHSLDKLKVRFSQSYPLVTPILKRKFKACRKFSSNWASASLSSKLILINATEKGISGSGSRESCNLNNDPGADGGCVSLPSAESNRLQESDERNIKKKEDTQLAPVRRSSRPKRKSTSVTLDPCSVTTQKSPMIRAAVKKGTKEEVQRSKDQSDVQGDDSSVRFIENSPVKKSYVARILLASNSENDRNGSSLSLCTTQPPKNIDLSFQPNILDIFVPNNSHRKTVPYTAQDFSDIILKTPDLPSAESTGIAEEKPRNSLEETDNFGVSITKGLIRNPQVHPGKAWRRSFINYKRVVATQKPSIGQLQGIESRRFSCRILVSDEFGRAKRKSLLRTYALSGEQANEEGSAARKIVMKYCNQKNPLPFAKVYPNSLLENCKKIGEGVYGEVYLYTRPNGITTVIKIIPIEGSQIINGEKQKKFADILPEVAIVSELSSLRKNCKNRTNGFCEVQNIRCVQGEYPGILLKLWNAYDELKGSENDCPDLFENDQLYIVLELMNGGQDLEAFEFSNAQQADSMFKQVAYSLAVAEEQLQFEHRDLHWGNVLLQRVDKKKTMDFKFQGNDKICQSNGVQVTIIDFTLSRMTHNGVTTFTDLGQDPELFLSEGDYQFDIYRLMKERNKNDWKTFTPYSNILWLHYILRKAMNGLRYKNVKSKVHKTSLKWLEQYETTLLACDSVCEFVSKCF